MDASHIGARNRSRSHSSLGTPSHESVSERTVANTTQCRVGPQGKSGDSMSRLKSRTQRAVVLCVAAALVVGGGGAAFAYWSSAGAGTGSATTGTSATFTVTSETATGGPLVPGGDSQSVAFTVTNPSTATLLLSSVTVSVANADGSTWVAVPGCSAADYTIGTPAITYGQVAGGAEVDGTVTVTMINRAANQDPCQDVTVPLYFVAS